MNPTSNKRDFEDEFVAGNFIHSDLKRAPSSLLELNSELKNEIHKVLKKPLEKWSNTSLEPTFVYGIREYKEGAVLEKGCVYLVPIEENLRLPADLSAIANAKSSTGRLDLLTRIITNKGTEFDRIPAGYNGQLFVEICPRSFSVLVRPGVRLNQIRFRQGQAILADEELLELHKKEKLIDSAPKIDAGLGFSVDLQPEKGSLVGYQAKPHTGIIDLDNVKTYKREDFW